MLILSLFVGISISKTSYFYKKDKIRGLWKII